MCISIRLKKIDFLNSLSSVLLYLDYVSSELYGLCILRVNIKKIKVFVPAEAFQRKWVNEWGLQSFIYLINVP